MKISCLFPSAALAFAALLFSSCRFQSYPAVYGFKPGVTYTVRYESEVQAKAEGQSGTTPYKASSSAAFSFKASPDTSKAQTELTFTVDSLDYHSAERGPEEDQYMAGRLKKYRAKLMMTRSGQLLSMEEEPGLPPVEFSTLNFGRTILYGLAFFPDGNIREGMQWESTQSLLDKFHPDSRVVKRYAVSSILKTAGNREANCHLDLEIYLDEDLGASSSNLGSPPATLPAPTLTGKGEVLFDLDQGRPISAQLEIEGRFLSHQPPKTGDSAQAKDLPLSLKENLRLRFQ